MFPLRFGRLISTLCSRLRVSGSWSINLIGEIESYAKNFDVRAFSFSFYSNRTAHYRTSLASSIDSSQDIIDEIINEVVNGVDEVWDARKRRSIGCGWQI